jgi:hypothetical protein
MNVELKGFLSDLVILLHQKYNETLHNNEKDSECDEVFRTGMNFAYFDALEMIESQLNAFGYDVQKIGNITPVLNKKASIK